MISYAFGVRCCVEVFAVLLLEVTSRLYFFAPTKLCISMLKFCMVVIIQLQLIANDTSESNLGKKVDFWFR